MGKSKNVLKKSAIYLASFVGIFLLEGFLSKDLGNLGCLSLTSCLILILAKYVDSSIFVFTVALSLSLVGLLKGLSLRVLLNIVTKVVFAYGCATLLKKKKNYYLTSLVLLASLFIVNLVIDVILFGVGILTVSLNYRLLEAVVSLTMSCIYYYFINKK